MASKKPRRIWSVLAGMLNTVSYVVLIIGLSLIISTFAILVANDVLALVKDGGELTVELKQESTPKAVGNLLMEMEAIEYPWAFELFSMLKKVESYEPGTYTIDTSMDYSQMISALRDDRVPVAVVRVTIPEGYNAWDAVEFEITAEHDITAADPKLTSLTGGDLVTGEFKDTGIIDTNRSHSAVPAQTNRMHVTGTDSHHTLPATYVALA